MKGIENPFTAMNYDEIAKAIKEKQEEIYSLQAQMESKKQEAIAEAMRIFVAKMKSYGVSKADYMSRLDEMTSAPVQNPAPVKNNKKEKETPALPEPIQTSTTEEENKVETKSGSVFDHPALKAPYNPKAIKRDAEPVSEAKLAPMSELLSDKSKEENRETEHTSKRRKKHLTMDELLSGEPINQIMLMGNLEPKGASYRQHSRISHADGIIPTETACGRTIVKIPA